jgi:hypothetical protein
MDDKQKFFYKGKFFSTYEELCEYASKWPHEVMDQESFDRILSLFCKDLWMNIDLQEVKFTKGYFNSIMEKMLYDLILIIHKSKEGDAI